MAKMKACFCVNCGRDTVHKKIGAETHGAERIFTALITVGFSEIDMRYDWECTKCGSITRE